MFIPGPGVLPKLIRTEFRRFAPNGFHAASKKKKKKNGPKLPPELWAAAHFARHLFFSARGESFSRYPPPWDLGRVKSRCLRIGGKPCPVL